MRSIASFHVLRLKLFLCFFVVFVAVVVIVVLAFRSFVILFLLMFV
jgi:hypothetical protein